MTDISYDTSSFPAALRLPSSGTESFTLAEIVWAAATVGQTPFSAPVPVPDLGFELAWRVAMVWANLIPGPELRCSAAYQRLDPSEKSAVSFFLGQVQSKLFAHRLFGVDIFVHLDRVLELLGQQRAKTRPDFIGIDATGNLALAVEAKGRSHGWTQQVVAAAKNQARALPGVVGAASTSYAHIAYFASGEWRARLVDPPRRRTVMQDVAASDLRRAYYRTPAGAFATLKTREGEPGASGPSLPEGHRWVRVEQARCYLGLRASALEEGGMFLQSDGFNADLGDADDGPAGARSTHQSDPQLYFAADDGVAVLLDNSWREWSS